jgi:hypothetical protein
LISFKLLQKRRGGGGGEFKAHIILNYKQWKTVIKIKDA